MTSKLASILIALAQLAGLVVAQADTVKITGDWKLQITFANGESRSLRFKAGEAGKGSFTLLVPKPNQTAPAELAAGAWTRSSDDAVTFSGSVEFPLGNVGLERGTLVLKGKLAANASISGEAVFFPADQDPKSAGARPSKSGTFTAIRD